MKPRLFIGSSLEGLSIAYAAQQNLQRAAEVTVWDQGVFQLSITALESLLSVLSTCDFGMFVFSPDDVTIIRGERNAAVRDNVIFELGLFVGVLGRERCFILMPDEVEDLRIPTDILGMTPGMFETGRSDGSTQAATAPACITIAQTIGRLGFRPGRPAPQKLGASPEESPKAEPEVETSEAQREEETGGVDSGVPRWISAMIGDRYQEAVDVLEEELSAAAEKDKPSLDGWLGRMKYYLSPKDGTAHLEGVIARNPEDEHAYLLLSWGHVSRDLLADAMAVIERGLVSTGNGAALLKEKARVLALMGDSETAATVLRDAIADYPENPDLYLALVDVFTEQKNPEAARALLEEAEERLPDNVPVLERYARLLAALPDKRLTLIPYGRLLRLKPDDPTYLSLRANAFLGLDLNDLAMRDYKKASLLSEDRESWILASIGNLFKNRGLYREGIAYLQRALALFPDYQYAHERLAVAMDLRDKEEEKLAELLKEGRRELIAAKEGKRSSGTETPSK